MTTELLSIISVFKDKINQIVSNQTDEINQLLDKGLNVYTINWQNKIKNVKTFLFNENPVDFETIYFPLSISYAPYGQKRKRISVPEPISLLFKSSNYITIQGHAGSGKTMLLKHCFLSSLKNGGMIPIIIELRKLNNYSGSFANYVSKFVFNMNLAKNDIILQRFLEQGDFIFLLDGYDELSLETKEKRTSEIEEFVDRYYNNFYLLTARPGSNAEVLSRFKTYHMCDLSDNEIKKFVEMHTSLMSDDTDDCKQIAKKMLSSIYSERNKSFIGYLKNPLLLSMFMLTYRMNPEIPSKRSDFYFNVFDTLYSKHDVKSKSGGYIHDRKCKLEKDDYQSILKWFSYLSYFSYKYVFDDRYLQQTFNTIKEKTKTNYEIVDLIYDFSVSISILLLDGQEYTFPHRSMQEYFAAYLISSLSEEIKSKVIYGDKLSKVRRSDDDNFWSLCREMDKHCFDKYFLIPKLTKLEEMLSKKKSNLGKKASILSNVIDMFNMSLIQRNDKINGIRYTGSEFLSIMRFVNLDTDFINPFMFLSGNYYDTIEPFVTMETEKESDFKYCSLANNKQIIEALKNSNLEKDIYEAFKKLLAIKEKYEDEMNKKVSRDEDLLNLI
ncbi:MAG: NACHT domain-containing protein [Bacteroidales bacterium]|nr:NACHT domain-containing protein [Bacteroidales bacterium]